MTASPFTKWSLVGLQIVLVVLLSGSGLAAPGRLAQPGDLDHHFGTGGAVSTDFTALSDSADAVAVQPDGKVVAAGFANTGLNYDFAFTRYNANGSPDGSFGALGGPRGKVSYGVGSHDDLANAMVVQPDGSIVAVGQASNGTNADFALIRLYPDGWLDGSFGSGGRMITPIGPADDVANAVVLQPDGKIVVAGYSSNGTDFDFALARYTASGFLDASFGSGGKVTTPVGPDFDVATSVVLQADGKIVAAGYSNYGPGFGAGFALVRYNANGSLDSSFGVGGKVTTFALGDAVIAGLALQPDGKIVAAGHANNGNFEDFALARYNANGSLDTSFGSGGTVTTDVTPGQLDEAAAVAVQADRRIVVAGYTSNNPSPDDVAVVRYETDGSLDTSFGFGGVVTVDLVPGHSRARAVALQPDGQIVVAGYVVNGANQDFAVARFVGWCLLVSPGRVGAGGVVTVRGQGFQPHELVDVYLDTTDLALGSADSTGAFHLNLKVPPGTSTGTHWVTAGGRTSGISFQTSLVVGSDWPMTQFGPTHSGTNPYELTLAPGNVAGLHVLWRAKLGSSGTHQTPVVQDGVAFAVGSAGAVYAVDAASGKQLWVSTALPGASPPAVDARAVVVSSGGNAYGLDPASGALLWTRGLASGSGGPASIGNGVAYLGTTAGRVSAIDTLTGVKLPSWAVFAAGGAVGGAPAVADGVVYFGAADGKVYALDASTGAALAGWPVSEGAPASFVSSPAVDGGSVFIAGQDAKLYALDAETGATLWSAPLGGASTSSPSVVDGTVYVGANDGKLYAFDEDSGALEWSTPGLGGAVTSSAAVANGVVYVTVQSKKKLFAIDAGTGVKLRSIATKANPSSAIVANGDVYVAGTTGLQAFGLAPTRSAPRPDPHALVPDPHLDRLTAAR